MDVRGFQHPSYLRKNDWPIISNQKAFALSKDNLKIQDHILPKTAVHEEKTLAAFYAEYYPQIRRYIASCIYSLEDADDLTQDVFLEFCRSSRCQNAEAYLFGIARKTILAYHRKRKKSAKIIPLDSIDDFGKSPSIKQNQDPTKQISQNEFEKLFEDVVEQLPPKAREAVKLRLVEGLDPEAAAKRAGCSIDTFYRRFYEGLKALRNSNSKSVS